MKLQPKPAPPPFLLAALTAALLLVGPNCLTWPVERPFQGAAPTGSSLQVDRGWQVHLDLLALDPSWYPVIEELLDSSVPPLGTRPRVWSITHSDLPETVDTKLSAPSSTTGSGARASAALRQGESYANLDLFQSRASPKLWSGPLSITPPIELLKLSATSPSPDLLRLLPENSQRLVWANFDRFTFSPKSLKRLYREWARWEPEVELAPARLLGPEIAYLHWRDGHYLIANLRDRKEARSYLEARFPSSLLPVRRKRRYGSLITGFTTEGPAWLSHGRYWYGSPQDGFESLSQLRGYQTGLDSASFRKDRDLFIDEVRTQLAQKSAWDLILLEDLADRGYAWAVGLVWNSDDGGTGEGFLVLEAKGTRLTKSK